MVLTTKDRVRFLSKVNISGPNECWEWKAGRFDFGHGEFWHQNKGKKAHRVMWVIAYGPIPTGKSILHHCDNPPCCNPRHLFTGTTLDNVYDMVNKGRGAKGDNQGHAKLTTEQVNAIRNERKEFGTSMYALAKKYGVTRPCIGLIINRKNWKHI